MEGRIPLMFPPAGGYIIGGAPGPHGWVPSPQRDVASRCKEKLNARMRRASRTIQELRERLADEKKLLAKERRLFGSGYTLPIYPIGEYPEMPYSLTATGYSCTFPSIPVINSEIPYMNFHQIAGDGVADLNLELTDSEKLFIKTEKEKTQQISNLQAYRKHLQVVEEKCRKELGLVHSDISNLKRVSTQLSVKIADDTWPPANEETVTEKNDILLDAYFE